MFIAAKYEEMYAPEIGEWIDFLKKFFFIFP